MQTSGSSSQPATASRPADGQSRRRRLIVLALALVPVWVLLTWRALEPPLPVHLPPYEPEEMVYLVGGSLPPSSGFRGTVVPAFRIDRFEVTEGDFARFIAAHPREAAPYHWVVRVSFLGVPLDVPQRVPPAGTEDYPVVHVDLHQARRYAAWRGVHIPTVEEWEWAALGGSDDAFPWGIDAAAVRANTREAGFDRRVPVGFFPTGVTRATGCYDMVGNVKEWTGSRARVGDGRYFVRGGSFRDPLHLSILDTHTPNPATRDDNAIPREPEVPVEREIPIEWRLEPPGSHSDVLGFRCAMSQEEYRQRQDLWHRIGEVIHDLCARDPVSVFLFARPARQELIDIGSAALRPLRIARRQVDDDVVGPRIDETIAAIERRVGLR